MRSSKRRPARRNPSYDKAYELYPKLLAFLSPTANAAPAEVNHARTLIAEIDKQYPFLAVQFGAKKIPDDDDDAPPVKEKSAPKPAKPHESPPPDPYSGHGKWWRGEAPKPEKKKPKRPKTPKAPYARRRPFGWTEADEKARADAWRAMDNAKIKSRATRKHKGKERPPESTINETDDGLLVWCGEKSALLYVLGKPRNLYKTCAEANAAADLWFAQKRGRREKYPLYRATENDPPVRV